MSNYPNNPAGYPYRGPPPSQSYPYAAPPPQSYGPPQPQPSYGKNKHLLVYVGRGALMTGNDFTLDQYNVTPPDGWKAYYAATRAIININAEFFRIIRDRSLPAMGQFWLNADYVKCFHASGEPFSGYDAVLMSWQLALSWENVDFQIRDVQIRVQSGMAWVTMKTFRDFDTQMYNVSNVYEFHNGRWCSGAPSQLQIDSWRCW